MKHKSSSIPIYVLLIVAALFLLISAEYDWNNFNSYEGYNTASLQYVRGRVETIHSEVLTKDDTDAQRFLGEQEITVIILEGEQAGAHIRLTNYLTRVHNVQAKEGTRLIICADTPENAEPYYSVFNYDRSIPLGGLILLLALSLICIGQKKGLLALLGVIFTLLTIMLFTIQAIYHGFSPVNISMLTILITSSFCLLLLNGISRRTATAFGGTLFGVLAVGGIFLMFSGLLHLSGYNLDTAESLTLVSESTGLSIRYLLLACTLISAMGAVMDVAVSLTAALDELIAHNPNIEQRAIFQSGLNIGKDMIGTMSNTLILAYAGSAMPTLLCLIAYGYSMRQFISSDFLAVEMIQGICATVGVVLTVPITAIIAAWLLGDNNSNLTFVHKKQLFKFK